MIDIVKNGPHIPMCQPIMENVIDGDEVRKPIHEINDEEKHLVALDVRAHAAIGNFLPYDT